MKDLFCFNNTNRQSGVPWANSSGGSRSGGTGPAGALATLSAVERTRRALG